VSPNLSRCCLSLPGGTSSPTSGPVTLGSLRGVSPLSHFRVPTSQPLRRHYFGATSQSLHTASHFAAFTISQSLHSQVTSQSLHSHFAVTSGLLLRSLRGSFRGSLPGVTSRPLCSHFRSHFGVTSQALCRQFGGHFLGSLLGHFAATLQSIRSHFAVTLGSLPGVTSRPLCSHFGSHFGVTSQSLCSHFAATSGCT
jgi:hypothetical protein